jgi:glyoxylase-like metal-dependent hydrolase (beta-lactamase superfamily II)
MKTSILFFLTLVSAGSILAQQTAPPLSISHLTGNFYVYTTWKLLNGSPFPSNSMYVVTDSGVVMIDTPWNAAETAPLLDSIEQRHHRKVVLCIVTHFHDDRNAGLDILKQRGIKTFSTAQTWGLSKDKSEPMAEYRFSHDTNFALGGLSFRTYYPGEGHTTDNIVVWFPRQKVLYGGCLVKSTEAGGLGNTADANLQKWPATIRNLMRKYPAPRYIIPGHMDWRSRKSLSHTLKLLRR